MKKSLALAFFFVFTLALTTPALAQENEATKTEQKACCKKEKKDCCKKEEKKACCKKGEKKECAKKAE